jgi:hypothetical protein
MGMEQHFLVANFYHLVYFFQKYFFLSKIPLVSNQNRRQKSNKMFKIIALLHIVQANSHAKS